MKVVSKGSGSRSRPRSRSGRRLGEWCQIGRLILMPLSPCTRMHMSAQMRLTEARPSSSVIAFNTAAGCLEPFQRAASPSKQSLTCQFHAFHHKYKLDDSSPFNLLPSHDIRNQESMASDPDRGLSGWGIFFLVAFVFIVIGGCAWIM